ncbi:unnamed protein product [Cylicocyclus nassatus]|uniref:HIG1 domain-containing protein n=1 Tax=Cylicocyclus nassatus TaxID=53992 RepID=A0AA36HIC8_CYLNA|nr:unnamed protein product [Cylicocyclus nassatus]
MPGDYPTPKEYAKAQKELGSCLPEFRQTVKRAVLFGASVGLPLGLYIGFKHHGRDLRAFAGKSSATWLAVTLTMGAMGVMTGTYNCLRIRM